MPEFNTAGLDSIAHLIQVALTPVFLLSGIGSLLNMFNTRLARVSDHRDHINDLLKACDDAQEAARFQAHLGRLRSRTLMLDASMLLGALGGAATCGAAFVLFVGGLRESAVASWLFGLFGGALGCTVCALMAFVADAILAWHALHRNGPMPHPTTTIPRA